MGSITLLFGLHHKAFSIPDLKRHLHLSTNPFQCVRRKVSRSDSSESVNVHQNLSPEAQRDLEDALENEKKEAWVEETLRNLLEAFTLGRKIDATSKKDVDIYNAVGVTLWTLYMIKMVNWPFSMEGSMVWLAIVSKC